MKQPIGEEVNNNTQLDNTDKKLHISDVRRSFSFTYDDLKQAFKGGNHVVTWSDMGIEMKYDNFEKWFDEWFKKKYSRSYNKNTDGTWSSINYEILEIDHYNEDIDIKK